jgi:hypothetical protein
MEGGAAAPSPGESAHARRWASNQRIAASARSHRFGESTAVPFVCECSSEACGELIRMPLGEFVAARELGRYLVFPGHAVHARLPLHAAPAYWIVGESA